MVADGLWLVGSVGFGFGVGSGVVMDPTEAGCAGLNRLFGLMALVHRFPGGGRALPG